MHSALAHVAHDPISPFTFDYRGTKTVISKARGRWCYGHSGGRGKRCAPTFRQAVILAKHAVDARHQYGHENPATPATENSGGGGVLLALVAAALAGGGVYLYMRHNANTAAITDPAQIIMAKINLEQVAGNPSLHFTYKRDQPMTSATPAFAQGLSQFQVAFNRLVTPDKLADLQKDLGQAKLPAFPLRTDGVLDRPTFDWLIYAQG